MKILNHVRYELSVLKYSNLLSTFLQPRSSKLRKTLLKVLLKLSEHIIIILD